MNIERSKLEPVRALWPDAELIEADQKFYVFLPSLKIKIGDTSRDVAALLRPWTNGDGYSTRLFFSEKISEQGNNWNVFNLVGRTWHGCSWNGVPDNIPWIEIIQSHLSPLI